MRRKACTDKTVLQFQNHSGLVSGPGISFQSVVSLFLNISTFCVHNIVGGMTHTNTAKVCSIMKYIIAQCSIIPICKRGVLLILATPVTVKTGTILSIVKLD